MKPQDLNRWGLALAWPGSGMAARRGPWQLSEKRRAAMIVVFGSVNVDFVTRVPAIPRPGETVLGPAYAVIPGGKGANQALAAARAGSIVTLAAAVGQDAFADIALALLARDGVDLSRVRRVSLPTGAAFIGVDDRGENAITVAQGANGALCADALAGLRLGPNDLLLLQREAPEAQSLAAARLARAQGARVALNSAPAGPVSLDLMESLDVLIANEHEAVLVAQALGIAATTPEDAARDLARRFNLAVIVTLGADGVIGWHAGERHAVPALAVTPIDTTAAGDAFCGGFAAALDQGLAFPTALALGVCTGSLACTRPGAQPSLPSRAEIDSAMADMRE
jgi:ribokinase